MNPGVPFTGKFRFVRLFTFVDREISDVYESIPEGPADQDSDTLVYQPHIC
jgi:hypothetical protein